MHIQKKKCNNKQLLTLIYNKKILYKKQYKLLIKFKIFD